MLELGFVIFMFIMQWLSIWAGVAKIDRKKIHERDVCLKQTFCTMGLPAIIGLIIAVIFFFTSVPNFISIIIYIALSVIFAFCGNNIYQKVFVKTNHKKNNKKVGKK